MKTEEAYRICHEIIKQHSKTFATAFSPLPKRKRQAVWAIYTFCRTVDDIVDEGHGPTAELEAFEQTFTRFVKGELPLNEPQWIALDHVFQTFQMDVKPFYEMIEGQRMDLYKKRYDTLEELEDYAYHVASTVGLMLLPVLAPENKSELHEGGIALGKAMQLTNILRDIGEDLRRDRIYLPRVLMEKHGVTEADLKNGDINDSFVELWEEIAERAEHCYQIAFHDIALYPIDSRLSVHGAGMMYRAILKAVRFNQYNVFSQKSFVPKEEKEMIITELKA